MDHWNYPTDLSNYPKRLGEVWQVHAERAPSSDLMGDSCRPWLVLIVRITTDSLLPDDLIISYDLVDEFPTPSVLWEKIRRAILAPRRRRPSRPSAIEFRCEEYCDALRPNIELAGIRACSSHRFGSWDSVFEAIVAPPVETMPSPLNVPGVSLEALGRFFAAAAAFYSYLPAIRSNAVIDVSREGHGGTSWRGLIGGLGARKLMLVEADSYAPRLFSSLPDMLRHSISLSVSFGNRHRLPTCYQRAIESNHWRIAAGDAHPLPLRSNPGATVRAPLAWELHLLTQVLRLVPDMLVLHRKNTLAGTDQCGDPCTAFPAPPRLIVEIIDHSSDDSM